MKGRPFTATQRQTSRFVKEDGIHLSKDKSLPAAGNGSAFKGIDGT
jgi:hypothetical protein